MTKRELCLVTGGSGYFGSIVVKRLLAASKAVRVLDLWDAPDRPRDVEYVEGDIRDGAAVARACRGVSVVHHNVAQVPLARDAALFWSVNEGGMRTLLAACREAGVRKVLNVSSSAVFGIPERNPVTEETRPSPAEEYGRAKVAAEGIAREFIRDGLSVTTIRPRTILGPGRLGIMQVLFEWARRGRNLPVMGTGANVYQFVHAGDLASACLLAAEREESTVYNIGADEFGTMRETLTALAAHAGHGSRVVSVPEWPTVTGMRLSAAVGLSPFATYHWLMYARSLYFDTSKAKRELGWTPRFGNTEMLCQAYDWYVEHREAVLAQRAGSKHRSAVKHGILGLVSQALRLAPTAS